MHDNRSAVHHVRFRPPADAWPFHLVVRRIDQPADAVRHRLEEIGASGPDALGPLTITLPLSPVTSLDVPTWETQGRLAVGGRRRRFVAAVQLGVTAWSEEACELTIRTTARRFARWGDRRQERYFRAAHDAADGLVDLLTEPSAVATRYAVFVLDRSRSAAHAS